MTKPMRAPSFKSFKTRLLFAVLALPMGEQVATLPPGRFMVSFMTLIGGVAHQYNSSGQRLAVADQFNREITFTQMAQEESSRSAQIEGMVQAQGISPTASVGHYTGRFEGSMQAFIPLVGYGITERVGIFVTAPILKIRTQFAAAFQPSSEFEGLSARWVASEQSALAANIQGALSSGFEQKIASAGYRYEPNSERTLLGDLQFVSPWIASPPTARLQYGLLNSVSIPTGQTAQLDDLYGIGVGSGRFAAGSTVAASIAATRDFKISASLGAGLLLPARLAKRIPTSADDFLPVDADPSVAVGFTPSLKAGVEARYQVSRSWSARAGYQFQREFADRFWGERFAQERYDVLASRSGQELHTLSAGIDFSLIQAFLDGDFLFPTQLGLAASLPFAGKNTMADITCLVQAALFF